MWSLWLLPAGAALFVYAADWGLPGARPETRRTAAPVAVASAVALAAVVVLSATLAHLRPPLEAKAPVVEEGAEAEGMEARPPDKSTSSGIDFLQTLASL